MGSDPTLDTPTGSQYPSDMLILALLAVGTLAAQDVAKSPDALEKQAEDLEARKLYDPAQKLLEAALSLRAQVSGDQSAEYGLCLLKLGAVEHKLIHTKESAAYYARAVRLLPGRPESARAFLYLGITAVRTTRTRLNISRRRRTWTFRWPDRS